MAILFRPSKHQQPPALYIQNSCTFTLPLEVAAAKRYTPPPDAVTSPEFMLLQQVAAGSQEGYRQLFEQYLPKLVFYLEPLCAGSNSSIDYQDVIQDIFLQLWEKKETLTAIRSFDHYLFRMAKNRFLDLLRKETSNQKSARRYVFVKKDGHALLPEDKILFDEYHQHAQAAIESLSPKLKTVFILSTQEDKSLDEIAEMLELSKETVKKRLYMARKFIQEYLRQHTDLIFSVLLLPLLSSSNVF
ncbi:MAG TPA: sigma-70 family RNA polymerase sigma factor [Flavitalea sp.]|nr:sigma-70 family RNA polymerase sigma factor [Flavitalea sp.]